MERNFKMNPKLLLLSVFTVFLLVFLSGCTSNNSEINSNDSSSNGSNGGNWLEGYKPVHSVGTGSDDFWINYPSSNPYSGQPVDHLPWIQDSLNEKCVVFVVHKTGCAPCTPQAERVIELGEKYDGQLVLYDLDIPLGGDIQQKAYDSLLYDPNGPPGYIALTGVFTYVKENGDVKIGWHTWEGDVSDSAMEDWVKDTIYYYQINKG